MTVEMPDQYGGKPIPEDAIEIALAAEKKKKRKETQGEAQGKAPSLKGFIYVPSVDLYFAKEKSHLGKEWYNTHIALHKQNLRMPTIPQFIEFLKYLKADPTAENTSIYDGITKVKEPWSEEYLDAKFDEYPEFVSVDYNHIVDSKGNLVAQENEKLEGHLMQNKDTLNNNLGISLEHWLNNPTEHGLPQENIEQGDLWYSPPSESKIASFFTNGYGIGLSCSGSPNHFGSHCGVRAVRARTQNAGGKQ